MADTNQGNGQACETLSRCEGQKLAEAFRDGDRIDPYLDIPPALLAADDIKKYVFKTGAVAPFDPSGSGGRLKKASYEGRIGKIAYEFDENSALVQISTDPLIVKANSIVFVETDIDFRLPEFMAVRFNLQIRHVHRGLLLGTGPIVDPGYWGKLCIPLHNLTDEDYRIPQEEGLIWIEFTKTSGGTSSGNLPFRRSEGYWRIKDLIDKAATPIGPEGGKTVAIRSSIPSMTREAEERAKRAEASARKTGKWVRTIGIAGIAAIVIALVGLGQAFYSNIQSAYNSIVPRIDGLQNDISELPVIRSKIEELVNENRNLIEENRTLRRLLQRLEGDGSGVQQQLPVDP